MGASLGGGPNRRRNQRAQPFAEINITPMVDVMLVLLVIFMVAAPMMTTGVTVDLPQSKSAPIPGQDEPLIVAITADGKIALGKTPIAANELAAKLKAITGEKKDTRIFLRASKTLDYGKVMDVMSTINSAGYLKVALITDSNGAPAAPADKPN